MKYIMFEDFAGRPLPIIFPGRIGHEEMREQVLYSKVLSAGYVQLSGGQIVCHGEAKDLGAKARPEDAGIISDKMAQAEG
jgi:hypothetical protein